MAITRDEIQRRAIEAIVAERSRGVRSTLLQMPTQTGKTRTACKYAAGAIAGRDARVLVLGHMGELLDQFAREFDGMGIKYRVEKADQRAYEWMAIDPTIRVCLGSKDTMQNRGRSGRLDGWPEDFFTDIIIDECDLAVADTFRNVRDRFRSAFALGLTATIKRLDGVPLGTIFDSTAFVYSIEDAIRNGHRVPYRNVVCDLDIDIREVKADAKGVLNPGELATRIGPKLNDLANVVRMHLDRLGIGKAIAFLPSRQLCYSFAAVLAASGVPSEGVCHENPARPHVIEAFRRGDFRVLCNQYLLGRAFNDPTIDAVIHLSPTTSEARYQQMSGRCGATRDGKDTGYLVFPCWESDLDLMGPTDIFAGDEPARVREVARKLARVAKDSDPQSILEKAREVVAADEQRERVEAERKLKYAAKKKDVKHRYREFDPIGVARRSGIQVADAVGRGEPQDPTLSARLRELGMPSVSGLSNHAMAEMVRYWSDRQACGMSTLKQFDYLVHRRKLDPSLVIDMTVKEASRATGQLHMGR